MINYAHTENFRYSSVEELAKVTNLLLDFEREIHGNSNIEVLKCWRLHLGSSETMKWVINSVSLEPTFCSRYVIRVSKKMPLSFALPSNSSYSRLG